MAETYEVTVSAVSLSAATAKSIIELACGATAVARITSLDISFKNGVTSQNNEVLVELIKYTTTGTGTAFTPLKGNGEAQNKAAICTAKHSLTVEGTGSITVVRSWYVPSTAAQMMQLPLGREIYVPSSTLYAVRMTSPQAMTAAANLEFEE